MNRIKTFADGHSRLEIAPGIWRKLSAMPGWKYDYRA
jgi:hypothetical protein